MNELYQKLINKIKKYQSKEEIQKIDKAYKFAKERHEGQLRKTKEEYIIHPLNVALILTDINADCDTICAALLHDTLEDTNTTQEEIITNFGEVVYKLVDGVTKINNINVKADSEYLTSYYKKIIVGMSEDVRVIIIKLADRLHNMRTLYALSKESQKENAIETLEILSPIAHRLGMYNIKSELEDLSLRYLKPEAYFSIVEKLNNTKLEREASIEKMMNEVSSLLKQNKIKHEIKGRVKSIYSIYKKLDKGRSFNDIYDVFAMRILVDTKQDCYLALGLIHSKYKPVPKRFKDYIAMPKTNLYQTLHTTVFGPDSHHYEIQIRTYDMDEIAENGIASHWAYKEHKNAALEMQNITEQKLQFYKSIIELNNEKLSEEDFVNSVKDEVLNNNIYVYTPKGDVIELPIGSTPIDFAYRVHTEVGDKMTGAIVNESIVSLNYELKNNDIIKIVTNKQSPGPAKEWLNIAKTTQAKSKIKAFFSRTNKEQNIEDGKYLLEKEIKRKKISLQDFYEKNHITKILKETKTESLEDLYHQIGVNKISPVSVLKEEQKKKEKISLIEKFIPPKKEKETDIIVDKIKNIQTHIANCCLPVPNDEIIGYITKTNGISIHRTNCNNIFYKDSRTIECKWNETITNKYISELLIETKNKDNIMIDLVNTAANSNITITGINVINNTNNNLYIILIKVKDKEELEQFINNLLKITNIKEVERTMKQ